MGLRWDWASSLKRNPLRINQMLRIHFQFRKLLNWKMLRGWVSVKGRNHIWLPGAYSVPLDTHCWRQTRRTFSLTLHNYFYVMLLIFPYTLSKLLHLQIHVQMSFLCWWLLRFRPRCLSKLKLYSVLLSSPAKCSATSWSSAWGNRDLNYSAGECMSLKLMPAVKPSIWVIPVPDILV